MKDRAKKPLAGMGRGKRPKPPIPEYKKTIPGAIYQQTARDFPGSTLGDNIIGDNIFPALAEVIANYLGVPKDRVRVARDIVKQLYRAEVAFDGLGFSPGKIESMRARLNEVVKSVMGEGVK